MNINDILSAIPWGILLSFTIGPVFFILLETGITKGFRAAMTFDLGVVFADVFFILIAYFSTNQLLQKLKNDPSLFIFGGVIMLSFGIISFIKEKKSFKKVSEEVIDDDTIQVNNYIELFFKGFLLNFINIGVLGFWLGIIIVFGPKLNMETHRIILFISTIIITYVLVDILKINVAKQLKSRLTPYNIYKIKRVISVILMIFGTFLMCQGFFPNEKEMIKQKLAKEFKK
ncbi:MAG: LysE family transporter [Flavobacterium sp.]|nr:LysE family transporter [Flavobacterium sp.]